MIQGFKKGDLVVHPNVTQLLRVSSISGPFAILQSAAEGFYVGEFPLAHLQLASEFCPEARDFRAGDIVIYEGEEARVDRAKNSKLWVEDSRKVHIVDKYQVRRAPIDVGNWVRVCATGLVGMVTSRDPSYVHAFKVSGSDDAYHERELARTTEPAPVVPMTVQHPFDDDDDTLQKVAEASNRAFASAGHVEAQQPSPPMIEVTNSVESQIVTMRYQLARLRNVDAEIAFHLKGRVDPIRPWSLDGSTVRINVSRDIDLEDFVSRYANFREVAPPEFIYEVRFSDMTSV